MSAVADRAEVIEGIIDMPIPKPRNTIAAPMRT